MAVYTSADQVQQVAAELFARLGRNEEVKKRTSRLEASFRFQITDLDTTFTLVIDKGTLQLQSHDPIATKATLKMDSSVFHEAMAGTLNLPMALVNRTLVIEGDTRAVLNLTALGKPLNATYQAVFEELMPKAGSRGG
jgi:putative sterol carrier protein